MSKNVVIVGASGAVGARVLHHLLARDDVSRVTALGRKTLAQKHPKLVSKVVDVGNAGGMGLEIPDAVVTAFCCLGTTIKQAGSQAAFAAVDLDAVKAFGEAALHKGAQRLVLCSSLGANAKSGNFYLKTKGEAEDALERLGFTQLTIVRPSFLDDEGTRKDHRLGEKLGLPIAKAIFAVVGKQRRYAPITVDTVGRAMVKLGFDDTRERTRFVESDQLHVLGA